MAKFRHKPTEIEAIQWTGYHKEDGGSFDEVLKFMGLPRVCHIISAYNLGKSIFSIENPDGEKIACHGDWIIKGGGGMFTPCKPDIFEATYEKVEE